MPKLLLSLTITLSLLTASTASTAEQRSRGVYLGIAGGSATLDDDGLFNGLDFDDEDNSASFLAGFKFNQYFSLEARYSYLGSYSVSYLFLSEDIELSGVSVHAVGTLPLGKSGFSVFGQLGVASLMADCSDCDNTGAGSAGLGIAYAINQSLSLALQVDSYVWEEDDDFSQDYDFNVSTAQIALRYTFE